MRIGHPLTRSWAGVTTGSCCNPMTIDRVLSSIPVLFRDTRFVVLDKPAGLPVHPGPSRRAERGGLVSRLCRGGRTGHGWRTGWMRTPRAAWWWRCGARRCWRPRRCSPTGGRGRSTGRWCVARRRTRRARWMPLLRLQHRTAGGWWRIRPGRPRSPIGACGARRRTGLAGAAAAHRADAPGAGACGVPGGGTPGGGLVGGGDPGGRALWARGWRAASAGAGDRPAVAAAGSRGRGAAGAYAGGAGGVRVAGAGWGLVTLDQARHDQGDIRHERDQ